MNVLIIEDEPLAIERLKLLLRQYDHSIEVRATLSTVRESILFLTALTSPVDFMLVDVQLADGPAFDIFKQVQSDIPVIFTTAYDQYALEAFQVLSVDYLLKPVTLGDLARAIGKIKILQHHPSRSDYKSRFLCRAGQRLQVIAASDVAAFFADGHLVRLLTQDNLKYPVDHTLEELENLLDPDAFFRANRNTILHARSIGAVKPFTNNRLRVSLKGIDEDDIIVSRERVAEFKKWADS